MNALKTLMALVLAITMSGLAPGRAIAGSVPGLWTDPDPIPKWITVDETSRQAGAVFYQISNDTIAKFSKIDENWLFSAIDFAINDIAGANLGEFTVQIEVKNSNLLKNSCTQELFGCWVQADGIKGFSIPDQPLDIETRVSVLDAEIERLGATAMIVAQPTAETAIVDVVRHIVDYVVAKVVSKAVSKTGGSDCWKYVKGEALKLIWVLYTELVPAAELLARGELSAAVALVPPMIGRIWSKMLPSGSQIADACAKSVLAPYNLLSKAARFFAGVDTAAMAASGFSGLIASAAAGGDESTLEVEIGFAKRTANSSPAVDPSTSPSSDASEAPSERCDLWGRVKEFSAVWNSGDPPPEISKSNLEGCDYRGLSLVNVDFRDTNLAGADFSGANLANAVFWNANLQGAIFKDASLYSTDFDGANLARADFSDTYLHYTTFHSTTRGGWKNWSVTTLKGVVSTFYAYLESSNFSGATFAGASFENAVLTNANFADSVLEFGGGWSNNWYDGASFVNFKYTALGSFSGYSFVGTDFTGAEIKWACGLDLSKAILTGVKLPSCYEP
jgi:uncharacterized protein YjbI with pentapeptide repeats